ncbi:hypothetical protein A1C_03930 [Rickettsia akari str. Hartford]|uniref:Uncharacterized protein n=1 Tax=Rickettsia akari (strain Hartford) TaxID=293614 RepID=A8GNT4_RICAH|nr:hypothetical protein [Rickettsia akari]ABV75059.1 hypothetical protein A1C_03930 [Rickettsia akari str. Hartford]
MQGNKIRNLDQINGIEIEQEYGYLVYNIKVDGLESAEYVLNFSASDKKMSLLEEILN